uniref:Peptidase S1 domain-containing protein n=1 Tax=Ascaris lumbricoides TaxID=6252 RepID=A0A9J2Q0Q5_ASCLU
MNLSLRVLFAILLIEQCQGKGGRGGGRGRSRGRSRGSSSSLSYYGRWSSVRKPPRGDAVRSRFSANSFPDSPSYRCGFRNSLSDSKYARYLPNSGGGSMILLLHPSVAFYYGGREYYWSKYFYENREHHKSDITICERAINQTSYLNYIFLDDNYTQPEALIWECDSTEYCCDAECCQKLKYVYDIFYFSIRPASLFHASNKFRWLWITLLIFSCIAGVLLWKRRKRKLEKRFIRAENEYRNSQSYLIRRMSSTKLSNVTGDPSSSEKLTAMPQAVSEEKEPQSLRLPPINEELRKVLFTRGKHLYHLDQTIEGTTSSMVFCRILLSLPIITHILCYATPKLRMGPGGSIARIVSPQDYPYVVEIAAVSTGPTPPTLLTGVLLSRSVILTAGHGFLNEKGEAIRQFARVRFRGATNDTMLKIKVNCTGLIYGKLIHPPRNKPFYGELVDYALFSLSQPLPVCDANDGERADGVPRKLSIIKLPVADVKSEKWETREIDHQLKDCVFIGYGEADQGPANGQLRMQDHIQVHSINRRIFIPLNLTTMLGRACPVGRVEGDSGAPLICRDENGEERIYGILSNSENSIPGQKKSCFSDNSIFIYCVRELQKTTFMLDILTDIRYILPFIRSSLLEMGKLDELIEDYEKCGYQSDQQTQTPESITSSDSDQLLAKCCSWLKQKPDICEKIEVTAQKFENGWVEYVEKRIGTAPFIPICELIFSFFDVSPTLQPTN